VTMCQSDRRAFLKRGLGAGVGLVGAGYLGTGAADAATKGSGSLPSYRKYKYAFVTHVYTNPAWVPARYAADDFSSKFGVSYNWSGSLTGDVNEMVSAINIAVSRKVDGIACVLLDPVAFTKPVASALAAGIPVVAINTDAPASSNNQRLAYIGQELLVAGQKMGERIAQVVPSGDVALFISTPGSLNVQPRIDGAVQALKSAKSLNVAVVPSGPPESNAEALSRIEAYYLGHKTLRGMFAVDNSGTTAIATVMKKYGLRAKGVRGGGFDLAPQVQQAIAGGILDFTIDQQFYLQGWLPLQQLFLYNISGGLTGPSDTNTGLKFVTKANVANYIKKTSRYVGTSAGAKVLRSPIPA
jgi:simple sugar transport system substrate-binding protein